MYQQSNLSLISITSDELRWLDAADTILQESSTTELQIVDRPSFLTVSGDQHSSSGRSSTTITTSTIPRHKNNRRHYQRSTKSSSAKVVNRMSGSFNRRHSRSSLNHIVTATVSSSSSSPQTSSLESPILTTSTSLPIKTPPRLNKRTASYSSTHSGSPGSEWIYRRPKSPSAASPPLPSAIKFARRTVSDSTASASTPSPASTADSSRCATPTSTTYRSGLAASYFPDVSTSCLNASSSNLPAHLVNCNRDTNVNNGSGSSIGSIGSIGVLIPSTIGLNSSSSSLTRQPSSSKFKASSAGPSKTGAFWTSILHPRSGPNSRSENPSTLNPTSGSRIARLSLGRAKSKRQPQPSSPLAVHTAIAIPSIWSGADLDRANGMSPKRRKARGSLKELGISRIPVSSRITGNKSPTSPTFSSPPIYNTPVKRRASHVRSGSFSSTTSSTTSTAYSNSSSTPSSPLTPLTPGSPTVGVSSSNSIGKTRKFQPKFEPHHRVIIEVVEDDDTSQMDVQRRKSPSPTKSILASRTPYSESSSDRTNSSSKFDSGVDLSLEASFQRKNQRKDSVSTTVSSNKSVKFVEKPTVHYASAIYESWDGTVGAGPFDYNHMGIDLSGMDVDMNEGEDNEDGCPSEETAEGHAYIHNSHLYAASDLNLAGGMASPATNAAADDAKFVVPTRFVEDFHNIRPTHNTRALRAQEREDTCVTPTPDRSRERTSSGSTGTGTLRSFVSLKRKGSTASSTTSSAVKRAPSISSHESKTATHRPTISGPFALGAMSPHLHPHLEASEHPIASSESVTEVEEKRLNMGLRSAGLRSAPSLESFKSVKSGKSMRSLKSLPESVKSGISLRAKGMRDWFKGRVTVSAM
ncbi:hypothetical protein GGU10DRAFT_401981 [Lentinula aff. detonsa]|uniref:Uncharacterized protein n=1 Tax=Lentinula aff. detonsa TaxID=2804958 RepID=A0AA38NRE1_9AGAR|nr:hypothetical protein GGU10DRAFT_401981 [Lentinula aff. detonsa]